MSTFEWYKKMKRRQVLKSGEMGNRLLAFEDKPMNWDNWDIDIISIYTRTFPGWILILRQVGR